MCHTGFTGGSVLKNSPANAGATGDLVLIPGLGRSPGEGNGNPLQYSCLENPMDRGAWHTIVYEVCLYEWMAQKKNLDWYAAELKVISVWECLAL